MALGEEALTRVAQMLDRVRVGLGQSMLCSLAFVGQLNYIRSIRPDLRVKNFATVNQR